MAHRTPPKTDDYPLLDELSPNISPPTPEDTTTVAPSPIQEEAPSPSTASSPQKVKGSPSKSKGSPLKIKFPSPAGKVKDMISRIERSRAHTLPTSPRSPKTPTCLKGFKSEGGTPQLDGSPLKRLGMLRSYAVPVKGADDGDAMDGDNNRFKGSSSLPDLEPGFFDRAMKKNNVANGENSTAVNTPSQTSSNHLLPESATTLQPAIFADSSTTPPTVFNGETTVVEANDKLARYDPFAATTPIGSVKSVEGYINMTKPSITDSGGYVKMQPALMTSYAHPKSPLSVATTTVYAVGESSSNNSDVEQNVIDSKLLSPDSASLPRPHSPDVPSDHSDLGSKENLFECDDFDQSEVPSKHKGKRTIRKRLRRLFKRHTKSVDVSSKPDDKGRSVSPASSVSTLTSERKPRSSSNVEQLKVTISEENNTERELSPPKSRSQSQNDVLNDVPGYPVKRSYTMLTDHITKKYQKKVLEKKRADSSGSGMSEASSTLSPVKELLREEEECTQNGAVCDLALPAKMSPLRYRRSLYCDQLKYKLRAALQNIHTPLSLSPIYLQLCVDDDAKCDSRYQLILLIQHALQRSRWRHDVMEIALLTELLKMIEPLPNEL